MEEGETGPLVLEAEKIEFSAEAAVVPALRLLHPADIGLQGLLCSKGGSVHPGEHDVLFVTPPVGSGHGEQAEMLHPGCIGHVGSPAEIRVIPLEIQGHMILLQLGDDLNLVGVVLLPEIGQGFLSGHFPPLHGNRLFCQAAHLLLDFGEVFLGDAAGNLHVIVKSVLDGRPYAVPRAGIEFRHRLGHEMGRRVAENVQPLFRVGRYGSDVAALPDFCGQVHCPSIQHRRYGSAFEAEFFQCFPRRSRRKAHAFSSRFLQFVHDSLLLKKMKKAHAISIWRRRGHAVVPLQFRPFIVRTALVDRCKGRTPAPCSRRFVGARSGAVFEEVPRETFQPRAPLSGSEGFFYSPRHRINLFLCLIPRKGVSVNSCRCFRNRLPPVPSRPGPPRSRKTWTPGPG